MLDCSSGKGIKRCEDCKILMNLQVLSSNAGYYIGMQCNCGPYSRESGYYKKRTDAEKELEFTNKVS